MLLEVGVETRDVPSPGGKPRDWNETFQWHQVKTTVLSMYAGVDESRENALDQSFLQETISHTRHMHCLLLLFYRVHITPVPPRPRRSVVGYGAPFTY